MREPHEFDHEFFPGLTNRAIRYYYYLTQGVNILNNFRNLFLGIFALYFTLKLDNWIYLIIIFLPSTAILTIVGFFATHKINKIMEWLTIRFSSHYAVKQFDIQRDIYDKLDEISKKLDK